MIARRLLHFSLNVGDLSAMTHFYCAALGFRTCGSPAKADPALAALLGADVIHTQLLHRGQQQLELAALDPPGRPYPSNSRSNDLWFQHIALATDDIAGAYAALAGHRHTPISRNGPQALPGGIVAFKFRDPEGHPLELIQFPDPDPATRGGIDHSAISVSDADASIAFYEGQLGLRVAAQQVNSGAAQDALDNLDRASADVVALAPERPAPHVELLHYRTPPAARGEPMRPAGLAATRMVFEVDDLSGTPGAVPLSDRRRAALMRDPDGHSLLFLG